MSEEIAKKADDKAREIVNKICKGHNTCNGCPLIAAFNIPQYKEVQQPCLNFLIDVYYDYFSIDERGEYEKKN